jgi:hypothetical protein
MLFDISFFLSGCLITILIFYFLNYLRIKNLKSIDLTPESIEKEWVKAVFIKESSLKKYQKQIIFLLNERSEAIRIKDKFVSHFMFVFPEKSKKLLEKK